MKSALQANISSQVFISAEYNLSGKILTKHIDADIWGDSRTNDLDLVASKDLSNYEGEERGANMGTLR